MQTIEVQWPTQAKGKVYILTVTIWQWKLIVFCRCIHTYKMHVPPLPRLEHYRSFDAVNKETRTLRSS